MGNWSDKDIKGESGLLDDYVFTVLEAKYGYPFDPPYEDVCQYILNGEAEHDGDVEDYHVYLSVGAFEPRNGKEDRYCIHETGDEDKRFNANSKARRFIGAAHELGAPVTEKGEDSRDAHCLLGSKFRIENDEYETTIDGEKKTVRTPLPTEYLGEVDVGAAGGTSSGSSDTSSGESSNGEADGDTEAKLRQLAQEKGEYMEFVQDAVTELKLDIKDPLLDENEGVWAEVNA